MMNDFLFFHAFYLRIFNNPNTFLDSKVERDEKRLQFLISRSKMFVVGTIDSGMAFPCVFEHTIGRMGTNMSILLVRS